MQSDFGIRRILQNQIDNKKPSLYIVIAERIPSRLNDKFCIVIYVIVQPVQRNRDITIVFDNINEV